MNMNTNGKLKSQGFKVTETNVRYNVICVTKMNGPNIKFRLAMVGTFKWREI